MIIGLTGGIAAGKSESAKYFVKSFGAYNIDADKISHQITKKGAPALNELVENLGKDILCADKTLNRKKLAGIIFSDKKAKLKVEKILHGYIISRIKGIISQHKNDGIVLVNAPLLFEVGLDKVCDKTVVVWIPYDVQLRRLVLRDKLNAYQARERIGSQMSAEKKIKLADFVIDNSGSKKDLKRKIENLYRLLTSE